MHLENTSGQGTQEALSGPDSPNTSLDWDPSGQKPQYVENEQGEPTEVLMVDGDQFLVLDK